MIYKLAYLAALLMCFSRFFAKIGFGGVYITEVTVLLILPAVIFQKKSKRSLFEISLGLFIIYHFAAAIFIDIHKYPIGEVIRDSIIWLYPITALYVAHLKNIDIEKMLRIFHKVISIWLFIYPVFFYFAYILGDNTEGNFVIKKTDATSAFALYILLSFYFKKIKPLHLLLLILGIFLVSTQGRSSVMILFFTLIGALFLNRKSLNLDRIKPKHLAFFFVFLLSISFINVPSGRQRGRTINLAQIAENALSIVGDSKSSSNLENTEAFRLFWWLDILEESIDEKFIFYGHGNGLNLADYYGYQVALDGSLRSPHNFVLTLLARSGWVITILLTAFIGIVTLKGFRLNGFYSYSAILITMMFLNAFFDVYLEGPMGAFPFWLLIGLILSKLKDVKRERELKQIDYTST